MSKSSKAVSVDPRDAFLEKCKTRALVLPDYVVDDLRYFRKKADEGRAISRQALITYFAQQRNLKIGHHKLKSIAEQNGIEAWWSV